MEQHDIAALDSRFGIPGIAHVTAGNGGLARVEITAPYAVGEMYLHGGHVTAWKANGRDEILFISNASHWQDGKPIRGGVPICFPWFGPKAGDPTAPAHGFVRTKAWKLESIVDTGASVTVTLSTESNDETKRLWPHDFLLIHRATFGAELQMELAVTNIGTTPLRYEEALHTYFNVGRIEDVAVHGLGGVEYVDKMDAGRRKPQQGSIEIVSETDRVYLNTRKPTEVEDKGTRRRINVASEGARTTVVWNPWIAKAKAMPDFGDDEWKRMICIETCNVADYAIEVPPGEQHTMTAIIRVEA